MRTYQTSPLATPKIVTAAVLPIASIVKPKIKTAQREVLAKRKTARGLLISRVRNCGTVWVNTAITGLALLTACLGASAHSDPLTTERSQPPRPAPPAMAPAGCPALPAPEACTTQGTSYRAENILYLFLQFTVLSFLSFLFDTS